MGIFGKEGVSERINSWSARVSGLFKILKNKEYRGNPDLKVRYASKISDNSLPTDTLFQERVVDSYRHLIDNKKYVSPSFSNRIFTQETKYLDGKKLGFRNEGEYPENVPNADVSLFHRFKPMKEYKDNKNFETFIGNSSIFNKIIAGTKESFSETDSISPVYQAVVREPIPNLGGRMSYIDGGGRFRVSKIGNNDSDKRFTGKSFGGMFGGHVILKGKNGLSIVSGSPDYINKEIINQSFDGKGLIEMFLPDNGTYNYPLKKTTKITKDDLKNLDYQNETGGTFGYIK